MGRDKNGKIALERGKFTFAEHQVRDIVFDLPLQFVEFAFGFGNAAVDYIDVKQTHNHSDENCRFGILPGADAGGFHNDKFPVGKHPVVNEQNRGK